MTKCKNLNLNVNKPNIDKKSTDRSGPVHYIVSKHPTQKPEHLMEDISRQIIFGAYLEYTL